jgi:NAD(P)-dependent dehydrogenase (short-subunit alcohol dehydrogenase family)
MKLRDKVAVITGGSSGIGLAIADACQHEGASVVIFGRNPNTLAAAERQLGGSILTVQGDVTDRDDLGRLFETTVEHFGDVDVLVANAGSFSFTLLGQTTAEDFDKVSDLNFKAVYFTVQAALPHLADEASVMLIGNAMTSTPVVGASVSMAAKAAVKSLARTFAVELAPRRIRVNVLSPGPTDTTQAGPGEASASAAGPIVSQIPLERAGKPEDLAKAAVFLASSDSSYITGTDLPVSGGIGLGWVPQTR